MTDIKRKTQAQAPVGVSLFAFAKEKHCAVLIQWST